MKEIIYFSINGKIPFFIWLESLDGATRRRVRRCLNRMSEGRFGDIEVVDGRLMEMRLFFGPGYRIYFTERDGKIIVIFTGGDKSTQKRDIAKAKEYIKLI